ncbi:MAG: single-stranded-DNA-specific exonuclease RecJ [Bryobacteraceae bacterium]
MSDLDERAAQLLASELKLTAPVCRVLCARNLHDPEAARSFLSPKLEDLHDPQTMRGLPEAAERLHRAIERREKVLIYGDYDADGTTSIVILKKAIELAGGTASFHVPHRLREGYGMRSEVVERAAAENVSLIVSVDTGIRAAPVVRRACELGIDVIITDHHLPEAELPPALAVLNPNQPDCPYPDKNLCGAGVAFKLIHGLFALLKWPEERRRKVLASFLKIVAIATVADVAPLTGENRIIVRHGLEGLRSVSNTGLRALMKVAGIADRTAPSAGQVAFRIAPRINAAGRMDTAEQAIELFLTGDPERARALAEALNARNAERRSAEAGIVKEILDGCGPENADASALVFASEGWHEGVLGIVAGRLVERFHRPAFVLACNGDEGIARGSGRGIAGFHLLEALESMAGLFTRFGGHRQAAGLTMPLGNVERFRESLNAYAANLLAPEDLTPRLTLDACLDLEEIGDRAVSDTFLLGPFGFGNPSPVFLVRCAELTEPPLAGSDNRLRLVVNQRNRKMAIRGWNLAHRAAQLKKGAVLDLALTFREDPYSEAQGGPCWTAELRDFRNS